MREDDYFANFIKREAQGIPIGENWEITRLENALKSWPPQWGNHLHVSLYGGIHLVSDIDLPTLGIHVNSTMETGDFVFGSPFCYDCQIDVKSKDINGFWDAIQRLEIFLNSCGVASSFLGSSSTKGAGTSIHYYCQFLFDGTAISLVMNEYIEIAKVLLSSLGNYPPEQQKVLLRVLWWLRQARHDVLSGNGSPSIFSLYLSYWNAFECLIAFSCSINPIEKLSSSKKKEMVSDFFKKLSDIPSPQDVEKCYREIINPGLKEKAKHTLTVVLGKESGDIFYSECFTKFPANERLYQIRNDIDHGNIVEYDFATRLRVINGLNKLQPLVLSIIYALLINKV